MDKENKQKKFDDYKESILEALGEKIDAGEIVIPGKATLIEGFFMHVFQDNPHGIQLSGKAIPSIMLVGENGQIYFFAVKAILPNIEI